MIKKMQTAGEVLKNKRRSLGKTIFEVSQETRIQERYVKALEQNDFKVFDSPVFAKGFMKIYAEYLNEDAQKVLALYRRQSGVSEETKKSIKRTKLNLRTIVSPGIVLAIILIAILVCAIVYMYVQFNRFQSIPNLEISEPISGSVYNTPQVVLKGQSSTDAIVKVNEKNINTSNGYFEYEVPLVLGENSIIITASNPNNTEQTAEQSILITYEVQKAEKPQTLETKESFEVYLKILSEPAWVQLNIDGKQKYAQIINPQTTKKLIGYETIEYITGKPNTTKLYINKKEVRPNIDPQKGTATLTCEMLAGEVICSEE